MTLAEIMEIGPIAWERFCEKRGRSVYAVKEGGGRGAAPMTAWKLKDVNPGRWHRRYLSGKEKVETVARALGVTSDNMRQWFKRHGLDIRPHGRPRKEGW